MAQGIEEQIGTLPTIETKLHFFQIGAEMLSAQAVPCPHDAALEKRERRFDGIGMNVFYYIAACTVVNGLVILSSSLSHGGHICNVVVCENYFHVFADILADIFCKGARLRIASMEESEIAVALA